MYIGPKMMARTTSITMQNLVEIARRTARRRERMKCDVFHFVFYRQDLPQAALPVFRLLTGRFWGFCPAGATRCTNQGQIWQGGADRRSAPHCQI